MTLYIDMSVSENRAYRQLAMLIGLPWWSTIYEIAVHMKYPLVIYLFNIAMV